MYPPNKTKKQHFFEEFWKDIDDYIIRPYSWAGASYDFIHKDCDGNQLRDWIDYSSWVYVPKDNNLFRTIHKNPYGDTKSKGKKLYPYATKLLKKLIILHELRKDI